MTPEERERTIDFIIASQARLAAAQEQDRVDRLASARQHDQSLKRHDSLMNRLAETQRQVAELITWQSQRIDYMEKVHQEMKKVHQEALRKIDNFQTQALRLLNMILDRLPRPDLPH